MSSKEVYCKSLDLANYVSYKFEETFKEKISPIKLQKSLYFLFAYWGGFVKKGRDQNLNNNSEQSNESLPLYLFDDEFQAWPYGPVIPSIYSHFKFLEQFGDSDESSKIESSISEVKKNNYILMFINDLLHDIFNLSDFKLVDITRNDKCWIDNFNHEDNYHKKVISKEEIINEYSTK